MHMSVRDRKSMRTFYQNEPVNIYDLAGLSDQVLGTGNTGLWKGRTCVDTCMSVTYIYDPRVASTLNFDT